MNIGEEADGVAIRFRRRDGAGADGRRCAGLVFDDEGGLELFAKRCGDDARDDVGASARTEWHHPGDRLGWPVLCVRDWNRRTKPHKRQ
jgi:hypothetical protein